jgi:hypothetical protein
LSDRLFNNQPDAHLEYENIPSVVFAHPEIGSIGLTEPEAREKYGDKVKIYKTEFKAMYFAMMDAEHKQPTAYKIVCAGDNEKVVGLHILGQGSAEILQGFGVAMRMGATKKDFDNCVVRTFSAFLFRLTLRPRLHVQPSCPTCHYFELRRHSGPQISCFCALGVLLNDLLWSPASAPAYALPAGGSTDLTQTTVAVGCYDSPDRYSKIELEAPRTPLPP